jgi:hypothetical protein
MNRAVLAFLVLLSAAAARGEEVRASASVAPDKLGPGARFQLSVAVDVTGAWHINANPAGEGLIPTTLAVEPSPAIAIERVRYPPGKKAAVSWAETPVAL